MKIEEYLTTLPDSILSGEDVQLPKEAFREILKFANINNIVLKEKRITRDEIYIADEAFFTGTAAEVTPIRELDNRIIGNGKRGPLTKKLQSQYFDCVSGKIDEYNNWLNYIP